MNVSNPPVYCASQIALASGIAKRTIIYRLDRLTPDAFLIMSGNVSRAWRIEALPGSIREALEDRAKVQGFDCAASLLNAVVSKAPSIRKDELSAPGTLYMFSDSFVGQLLLPGKRKRSVVFKSFQEAVIFCIGTGHHFVLVHA